MYSPSISGLPLSNFLILLSYPDLITNDAISFMSSEFPHEHETQGLINRVKGEDAPKCHATDVTYNH